MNEQQLTDANEAGTLAQKVVSILAGADPETQRRALDAAGALLGHTVRVAKPPHVASPLAKRSANSGDKAATGNTPFDPQPIVNAMREDARHDLWEAKVLHAKGVINKIKLVCWFDTQPRTTGEVRKILDGLGVKIGLPNVSDAIKASQSEFLQDGARTKGAIIRYRLTSKAAKDFGNWLNTND